MTWDHPSLWNKSKLFMTQALELEKTDPLFGLWLAMGLELLSRAALSKISPILLAEPEKDHKYLLSALGLGNDKDRKSIPSATVLKLCQQLITSFTETEFKFASALAARRNEEVHSGASAFADYPVNLWLHSFYQCCKVLSESMGENLSSLLGVSEATAAEKMLAELNSQLQEKTRRLISSFKNIYESWPPEEQARLTAEAQIRSDALSHAQHHRIACPACNATATVTGSTSGPARVEHLDDGNIKETQEVIPNKFICSCCGLNLDGVAALVYANLAEHFYRKTFYTPEEFYDLYSSETVEEMKREYGRDNGIYEFNNE